MTFEVDLERGKKGEVIVLDQLRKRYPCSTLVEAYKGYDIWVPEMHIGIEVKYDPESNNTGNYLIEYEMRGKTSALLATTAKIWAFYDDQVIVWIKHRQIIKCIFDHKHTYRIVRGPGDSADKKCFLVKKEELKRYAFREETIS